MTPLLVVFLVLLEISQWTLAADEEVLADFSRFRRLHGRKYTAKEERIKRRIFQQNWRFVRQHNEAYRRGDRKFQVNLNHLADLTVDETKILNSLKPVVVDPTKVIVETFDQRVVKRSFSNDSQVNWVTAGAVTAVKNQGACGSCWSFAATGALEGAYKIATGVLTNLSEQNLIDCDNKTNRGCTGGWYANAWENYVKPSGVECETKYPYSLASTNYYKGAPSESCKYESAHVVVKCDNVIYVTNPGIPGLQPVETTLMSAVREAPIAVAVHASQVSFMAYKSGIYDDVSCSSRPEDADHAMLVVGYDSDPLTNVTYWLVKNRWGENGYIRIKRGANICGIANWAARPKLIPGSIGGIFSCAGIFR